MRDGQLNAQQPHSMQAMMWYCPARSQSRCLAASAILVGTRFSGQTSTQRPQRTHACSSAWRTSSCVSTVTPLVPLVTGLPRSPMANPIIGPPLITRAACSRSPPQKSTSSWYAMPTGTSKFFGCSIPAPDTVTTRWVNGLPRTTARATAAAVPTFITTTPTSSGRPPVGTSRPSTAGISCFSPPIGYLVLTPTT